MNPMAMAEVTQAMEAMEATEATEVISEDTEEVTTEEVIIDKVPR